MSVRLSIVALLAGLLFAATAFAQQNYPSIPDLAPTSRYQVNGNGTAIDLQTGLMWMRCSLGQDWDAQNSTCTGTPQTFTWQAALQAAASLDQNGGYAGFTDWRVPNIRSLSSLARFHSSDPAINLTVFPGTPSAFFWSASPVEANTGLIYAFNAATGKLYFYSLNSRYSVRLVRAGAFK